MKLIEQNPFRILGIAVNATAKELAGNMGKKKLLDIGKEVSFQLDLPNMLSQIQRTVADMDAANAAINQPQDKVKHSLFWFAVPTSGLGNVAYNHLLEGNTDKAVELFSRCPSWESKLCLSTISLQNGNYANALSNIANVIDNHCNDLCMSVVGQTYTTTPDDLWQQYLTMLTNEIDASMLLGSVSNTTVPSAIAEKLRTMAVDSPIAEIDKAIASAKSVDADNASAQLKAGKTLMKDTKQPLDTLKKLIGTTDLRYTRVADKLAKQILQCSINYFNKIEGENRTIINNALGLGNYAQSIAVGKMALDHIKHNVDILKQKLENLPPEGVEVEVSAIMNALRSFVSKPDKIEHSVTLLNTTKPHLQNMKAKLGATNAYYLKISTQVVASALHKLIEEVNHAQRERDLFAGSSEFGWSVSDAHLNLLWATRVKEVVTAAWNAIKKMDAFDMEKDFKSNRYKPNKKTLRSMCSQLDIPTGEWSWGCIINCIIWGFLVIFVIALAMAKN